MGHLPLSQAKPYHLRLWVQNQARWQSNWTKRRAAATVKAAFGWAVRLGLIDDSPFSGVSFPAGERGGPMKREQFQAMLRGTTAVVRRLLIFRAGRRPGEMAMPPGPMSISADA